MRLWFVGEKIVCTVRCYSLGFQGSGHGFWIGYGLILDNVVWAVWRTDVSAGSLGGYRYFSGGIAGTSPPTTL